MKTTNALLSMVVALGLAACNKTQLPVPTESTAKSAPSAQTVQYYVEHKDERMKALADCKSRVINTLDDTADAQNCRAAGKAANDVFFSAPAKPEAKTYKGF